MAPIGHLKLACGRSGREHALWNYMEPDKFAALAISQSRADAPCDLRGLARHVATFRKPSNAQGAFELAVSAVPLVLLWLLMLLALDYHYGLTLLLSVPAAGFLLRLFLIQHDCGHGAFFKGRRANDWVGRCIGVVTLSPYDLWRRGHATHHAGTGNLDRRGIGDVDTLTVSIHSSQSSA